MRLAQESPNLSVVFQMWSGGFLYPHLPFHLTATRSAYLKQHKETCLRGERPKDSSTKADPNENVTKKL